MFAPEQFLDLNRTEHRIIFENVEDVWQALPKISAYLKFRLKPGIEGRVLGRPFVGSSVFVGKGTVIEQGAMVKGPAWIGENCEIRNGCYIRENVIIGNGVVAGNSCEFKNCLVFDQAQVPHFTMLAIRSWAIGASWCQSSSPTSSWTMAKSIVTGHNVVTTGLRKFGAILRDYSEWLQQCVGAGLNRGTKIDCLPGRAVAWRARRKSDRQDSPAD
jgi:NDP-sugar pyrophosphorylase family protein